MSQYQVEQRVLIRNLQESFTRRVTPNRAGNLAVLIAVLLVPIVGMLALSVDVSYSMRKSDELQRAADLAALAGARALAPDVVGTQDLDVVRARISDAAKARLADLPNFTVLPDDVVIGKYDVKTAYTNFTVTKKGTFDTVQVTLRRDRSANNPLPLLFGGIFGDDTFKFVKTRLQFQRIMWSSYKNP